MLVESSRVELSPRKKYRANRVTQKRYIETIEKRNTAQPGTGKNRAHVVSLKLLAPPL